MKLQLLVGGLGIALTLSLTGCDALMPNFNPTPTPTAQPTETAPAPKPTPKPTPTKDRTQAEVVILSSMADLNDGIEVIAQVATVAETGGTCTLTVSQAGTKKSVSASAEANVTETQCFPLRLPVVGFAPGVATFTVSYESELYQGLSAINQIVIP